MRCSSNSSYAEDDSGESLGISVSRSSRVMGTGWKPWRGWFGLRSLTHTQTVQR